MFDAPTSRHVFEVVFRERVGGILYELLVCKRCLYLSMGWYRR
jgi:hypothetical protein